MPRIDIVARTEVKRTARLVQLASMMDLDSVTHTEERWSFDVDLPASWNVGLIVGPSGSGKSTVARELFGTGFVERFDWPADHSIIDGFEGVPIKEVGELLSSVGFSSPPAWLRPYHVLSTGQRFRCDVARSLAGMQPGQPIAFDEFTSVVDRTVAQVGSTAIARAVRARGCQFVAVSCHYDIIDWLQPDWVLEMPSGTLTRREVQRRPTIQLEVSRVSRDAWDIFRQHHYLDTSLHVAAHCFVATWEGRPVAFASSIHFPNPRKGVALRREHRTVCLPDFQGVGIGNALSAFIASLYRSGYRSTTSHPAMIRHRAKSPLWSMVRAPARARSLAAGNTATNRRMNGGVNRLSASFTYRGKIAANADIEALSIRGDLR